jgi:hypothetical protein
MIDQPTMKAIVHERGRPDASSVNSVEWYGVTGPIFARIGSGLRTPSFTAVAVRRPAREVVRRRVTASRGLHPHQRAVRRRARHRGQPLLSRAPRRPDSGHDGRPRRSRSSAIRSTQGPSNRRYRLEDAVAALEYFGEGHAEGKVVVTI